MMTPTMTSSVSPRLTLVRDPSDSPTPSPSRLAGEELDSLRAGRRIVRFDLDAPAGASIRLARVDAASEPDAGTADVCLAALPDLARSRRESMAAARRLLNARLSSSATCLDIALDRMIDFARTFR
jgi:hypothetical protein